MSKTILVTGSTSGFGKAIAIAFAQQGNTICITGRRAERLTALKDELEQKYAVKVIILEFDVRDKKETEDAVNKLKAEVDHVDILVNNAGLASGLSSIDEGNTDDWDVMIDTNVKGLLYVTKIVSGWMVDNQKGHIVNIGSTAGKEVYPNGNVYCATKHAVDALNKGMRIDLLPHGIKVTAVNPGMVETAFSVTRFKGDEARAGKVYEGLEPLIAQDIAEAVWFAVSRPAHVNINDMVITPTAQANSYVVKRK